MRGTSVRQRSCQPSKGIAIVGPYDEVIKKGEAFRWAKPNLIAAKLSQGEAPQGEAFHCPRAPSSEASWVRPLGLGIGMVDTVCKCAVWLGIVGTFGFYV